MVANARTTREHGQHSRPRGYAPRHYPNWNADEGQWYNDDGAPQPSAQERRAQIVRAQRDARACADALLAAALVPPTTLDRPTSLVAALVPPTLLARFRQTRKEGVLPKSIMVVGHRARTVSRRT